MAHGLLLTGVMILPVTVLGAAVSGCVIPPPLEIDEGDAGVSAPPTITGIGPPDLSFPGPLVLDRQDERQLSLTIEDPDLGDSLYIRLFVDYDIVEPTPERAECEAPPSGTIERVVACPVANVCGAVDDGDQAQHLLEVVVADRAFLADNDPAYAEQEPYRALPENAGRGEDSALFSCNPAE